MLAPWLRQRPEPGLNYLCPGYKDFFHHVDKPMRIMSALLGQNRAPSEIVRLYEAEDTKRGRNDPCTCGSGRKWKNCHGAETPGAPPLQPTGRARRPRDRGPDGSNLAP